jgi:cation transport regulator ChaB
LTITLDSLPKAAKGLPPEAQRIYVEAYNRDFGWRSSEAHAEKAAWRAVLEKFPAEAKAAAAPKAK